MKSLMLSILVFCLSLNSFAAQSLSTKLSGAYTSLRAMGMGNAFTAVADDYSLIYYNPAGFARKPYNEVQISLIGAGVSSKTLSIVDDISKASDTPGTDNQKAQAISDALDKYYGQSLGGKLQALEMFWVRKGWGIGFIPMDLTIDMSVNRQLGPALDLNVKGDSSLAFGYGMTYNKEIDLGITAKYLHRVAIEQSLSTLELATDSNVLSDKRFKEGTNIDFDLGVMYTPDWFGKKAEEVKSPEAVKSEEVKPEEKKPEELAKPEEAKPEEKKSEEQAKPEEPRKPNADTPAEIVQVPEEKKTETPAAEATPPVENAAAANTEAKKEETPAGVVKLGDQPAAEKKPEVEINQGVNYPLTLGLTVHNVMASGFTQSKMVNKNATDTPTKLERTIDIGSQYRLVDGEDFKIRAMLDVQNILHPNVTLTNSLHAGIEFDYSPSGWFRSQARAGMNQMYFTAGVTLMLGILNIDVVTYGEEVGTESNKIENRVMAAKLGFNF